MTASGGPDDQPGPLADAVWALRLRWKRRKILWRCLRARQQLTAITDRTDKILRGDILVFATLRNEALRLPEFLDHYRKLGAGHFLIVDHDSTDGSAGMLRDQPDVSLWTARGSYHATRFGLDWIGWLLARHGHGHWCLTVDADELLIYPHWQDRDLHQLTRWLDDQRIPAMGALMLEIYPRGPIGDPLAPGMGTLQHLEWFDPGPYRMQIQQPRRNRWVQGGARERVFFADRPARSPTLNKLPLVRWRRGYSYVNSTHSMLPRRLNDCYDGPGDPRLSGVLLHTKFLPDILPRSAEEKQRRQHFIRPQDFDDYYDALIANPVLWYKDAMRHEDWQQLVRLGLMGLGDWT